MILNKLNKNLTIYYLYILYVYSYCSSVLSPSKWCWNTYIYVLGFECQARLRTITTDDNQNNHSATLSSHNYKHLQNNNQTPSYKSKIVYSFNMIWFTRKNVYILLWGIFLESWNCWTNICFWWSKSLSEGFFT